MYEAMGIFVTVIDWLLALNVQHAPPLSGVDSSLQLNMLMRAFPPPPALRPAGRGEAK